MGLDRRIKQAAEESGADFYGVADLSPAYDAILAQGGGEIASYPRAISIGVALSNDIVDRLSPRPDRETAKLYRHHSYVEVNGRLGEIAGKLAAVLTELGYRALPLSASTEEEDERLSAAFSHKIAAHLAGLGWIGKSCLLVTPTMGPRVRWATALIDAPLETAGDVMKQRCGSCSRCVDICPPKAFTGRDFDPSEPRQSRYDACACDDHFKTLDAQDADSSVCGLCLWVCPFGRGSAGR